MGEEELTDWVGDDSVSGVKVMCVDINIYNNAYEKYFQEKFTDLKIYIRVNG